MDDDLSPVLRFVNRKSLANDLLTRSYLEAGIRILEREFFAESVDNDQPEPRSFRWISRSKVIAEVAHGPQQLARQGGEGTFRDRWSSMSDYLGDLILYALRSCRWGDRTDLAKQAADAINGGKLSEVVHEVTFRDLQVLTDASVMRFLFLFTAIARDPVVGDAIKRVYSELAMAWVVVYAEFFRDKGMSLRPGVSLENFTIMLSALADGIAFRRVGDRESPVLDHGRRRSLLGTGVLALATACVDSGDGLSVEEAADRMFDSWSDATPPTRAASAARVSGSHEIGSTAVLERLTAKGIIARATQEQRPTACGMPRPRPRSRRPLGEAGD